MSNQIIQAISDTGHWARSPNGLQYTKKDGDQSVIIYIKQKDEYFKLFGIEMDFKLSSVYYDTEIQFYDRNKMYFPKTTHKQTIDKKHPNFSEIHNFHENFNQSIENFMNSNTLRILNK